VALTQRHPLFTAFALSVVCAAAFLPLGDVLGFWGLMLAPAAAALAEARLARQTRFVPLAAGLTVVLMVATILVAITFWGL